MSWSQTALLNERQERSEEKLQNSQNTRLIDAALTKKWKQEMSWKKNMKKINELQKFGTMGYCLR